MKPDVLIAVPLHAAQMKTLEQTYTLHRLDHETDPQARDALMVRVGQTCTALVANGTVTIDAAYLDKLPALKIIASSSAGFDKMDYPELQRRGIALTTSSSALLDEVADTALLLMLAARRCLITADAYVRSGDWGRKGQFPLTQAAKGKKVGILGLGHIGQGIANRCAALGMDIGYCNRHQKSGVSYPYFANIEALADWADVLIVATPGGAETKGVISAKVLAALGAGGTFVNIARGSVVDEPALIAALKDGTIGSAGLDVFVNEPNPDPALTSLPNVVLYPHHASGTQETRADMSQSVLDNLAAFFAGKPLVSAV